MKASLSWWRRKSTAHRMPLLAFQFLFSLLTLLFLTFLSLCLTNANTKWLPSSATSHTQLLDLHPQSLYKRSEIKLLSSPLCTRVVFISDTKKSDYSPQVHTRRFFIYFHIQTDLLFFVLLLLALIFQSRKNFFILEARKIIIYVCEIDCHTCCHYSSLTVLMLLGDKLQDNEPAAACGILVGKAHIKILQHLAQKERASVQTHRTFSKWAGSPFGLW